jgi:hypothetical protein
VACVCKKEGLLELEGRERKYGKIRKNMSAAVWHQLSSYVVCSPLLIISSCTHISADVRVLHAEGSHDWQMIDADSSHIPPA